MTNALLIIDVQNDFTEGGALGVNGGTAVAREISAYLEREARRYAVIVGSRDWHHPNHDNGGHFATEDEPDFVETWPEHCVADTSGAEYHPSLDTSHVRVHILKGQGTPSYSAFEGHDEEGRPLARVLRDAGVTRVDVVGIATDYCVRASALDAKRAGFEVRVLADLTAPVSPDAVGPVFRELELEGIEVTGEPVTASA